MAWPKHKNPTQDKAIACAPYNFVPLPDMVVTVGPPPDQDQYYTSEQDEFRYTGHLTCDLTTLTPLYTRSKVNPDFFNTYGDKAFHELDEAQKNERAQFFHIDDAQQPVIPGSSLRGMLRALVEIVSYSKVQEVSDRPLVYRAVGDTTSHGGHYRERIMRDDGNKRYTPLVQAGYIQTDGAGWRIQPAQQIGGVSFARIWINDIPASLDKVKGCKNAAYVYIQPGPYEYQDVKGGFIKIKFSRALRPSSKDGSGLIKGTLAYSGPMTSKRTEAVVFPPDPTASPIPISFDLEQVYHDQISQEQQDLLGKNGVLNEGQPVFYLVKDNKLAFFSHTMMMRLPYLQSPRKFVPEKLRNAEDIDLAEAMFGYTKADGEGKARACAGRVFVSEATLVAGQSQIWLKPDEVLTPQILGGPKPTTFQHYLTQQQPDPQEAGRTKDGRPKFIKQLSDFAVRTPLDAVLRGIKLYWHKGQISAADIQADPKNVSEHPSQYTRFKPVAPEVKFEFKIRFENLSDKELGALLWALTLPGEPGKQYRHSLGMGKPLGLGAVKLTSTLYLSDRRARYTSLFNKREWDNASQAATEAELADFINRFDRFIRQEIKEKDYPSLAAVERIGMLLKLLEWPGPAKELTRYLEIEHHDPNQRRGKVNEYKERPVLPDPLHMTTKPVAAPRTGQAARPATPPTARPAGRAVQPPAAAPRRETQQPPARPAVTEPEKPVKVPTAPVKPATRPEPELSHPKTEAEVQDGMYLEGQVVRVESGRVVMDIGVGVEVSLSKEKIVPAVQDEADLERRFRPGKQIKVFVSGRNKKGRIQLTMQRP